MTAVPKMLEKDFQRQVTDLATVLGWEYAHFRPAKTDRGWRTPVSGTLGGGWPDLVLVRQRDKRLLFVELKRDGGKTSPDQDRVLEALGTVGRVYVFRPQEFDHIVEVLT